MTDIGVVACETLYADIAAVRPDVSVRYVPQEFHEFPIDDPLDDEIAARVQAHVDAFDEGDCDRIVVVYARSSEGLSGVRSSGTPLVVSRARDCISLFGTQGADSSSAQKATGTYYLTRGWIDCGVDCYKLYHAYRGGVADLQARFDRVRASRRVTWADGDRFRRVVNRGRLAERTVDQFFHEIVQFYDRVALVDTGLLGPFDREYAAAVSSFIETLRAEHGETEGVDVDVVEMSGDRCPLTRLLGEDPHNTAIAEYYPPGTPVE